MPANVAEMNRVMMDGIRLAIRIPVMMGTIRSHNEIWKVSFSAFRGSLEWSAQGNPEYSICAGHLQYVLNAIMFFEILFQIYPTILSGTPYQKFHAEASDMPPPAAAASFLFHY